MHAYRLALSGLLIFAAFSLIVPVRCCDLYSTNAVEPTCLASEADPYTMGFKHREYLTGTRIFGCSRCRTHLTTIDDMISRQFNGQHGRAYLFERAVNTILGPAEDRPMTTGMHTVRDVMCGKCEATLGWKYERAFEQSQKYKEGKVILEKALLVDVQ